MNGSPDFMGGFMQANPYTAAIAAAGSAANKALERGTATGGTNSASGLFDHSGWSVNFGSGSATASQTRTSTPAPAQVIGQVAQQAAGLASNPLVLAVVALGLFLVIKK